MKINKVNFKNEEALIIYLTQSENSNIVIKNKIAEYKKVYSKVTVFISGDNNIEEALKTMLQKFI